jgi:CheY-like chemotaxis protein
MSRAVEEPLTILMADDDAEDRMLTAEAFQECRIVNELRFVEDGVELVDYLFGRNGFHDSDRFPLPGLILLDLNMPKMDGREALREIKNDDRLRQIPIVVLTTSAAEEDILRTYELGISSYITKPVTFNGLLKVVKTLGDYWFELVELPRTAPLNGH